MMGARKYRIGQHHIPSGFRQGGYGRIDEVLGQVAKIGRVINHEDVTIRSGRLPQAFQAAGKPLAFAAGLVRPGVPRIDPAQ